MSTSLDELASLCGYDEKNGTTMLGLQNAAKAKGLQAVSRKISIEDLVNSKCQAIAHCWDEHEFVIVEPGDADTITVTDWPCNPEAVEKKVFKEYYSGFALLVAKDATLFPKSEPNGPDLRFDSDTWDFGSVMEGDKELHSFKCRNVGNADLVISKVDTSCGDCLVPKNRPQTIRPGGEGEITAVLDTAHERWGLAKTLYVRSNDPISPVVQIAVTGYVRPAELIFSPKTVSFGHPRRTETASR